jgi:FAD/FMN-containing dehydrogenase
VTADGRVLRASREEHPDLFWALKGGGGNFGVVTEFVFRLHPVGPMARVALLFWELDRGPEALRLVQDVFEDLPPDLNVLTFGMSAPPAPFVPPEHQGALGVAVVVTGFGEPEAHAALVRRLQQALPPQWAVEEELTYSALQQFLDEPDPEARAHAYYRSSYVTELSDAVIDVVLDSLPRMNSPLSALAFYRLDGAFSAVGDEDTAFSGGREPGFAAFIIGDCPTPDLFAEERLWAREVADALAPLSRPGIYVNGVSEDAGDRAEAAYGGEKYRRLARVKARYDPANLFHRNHNIRPAPRA